MAEKVAKTIAKKPEFDVAEDGGESVVVTRRSMAGMPTDAEKITQAPKIKLVPLGDDSATVAEEPAPKAEEQPPVEEFAADLNPEAGELAAAEEALKAQEKVNALIENRTYILPIDAAGKRASRLEAVCGTVLIIALALLLIDLMLDAGFVHIPGVKALTHFFTV